MNTHVQLYTNTYVLSHMQTDTDICTQSQPTYAHCVQHADTDICKKTQQTYAHRHRQMYADTADLCTQTHRHVQTDIQTYIHRHSCRLEEGVLFAVDVRGEYSDSN